MRKLTNRRAIKKLYMPHKVLAPIVEGEVVENVEVSEEIDATEKVIEEPVNEKQQTKKAKKSQKKEDEEPTVEEDK